MAIIGRFIQTPTERKRYLLDYADWFASSPNPTGTISSIAFESVPSSPTPAEVDAYEINDPATDVTIFVSGGVTGTQYRILVTMTTSDGQIKEDEIVITCRVPPGT